MPTHYEVLEIRGDAPPAAVRRAFREAAKRLHPDAGSASAEAMVRLNQAYDVLKDPARRRAYDAELSAPPRPLPPRPSPREPVGDALDYLAKVFGPLDARLRHAASVLRRALDEIAYDVYDDAYLARFGEAVSLAGAELRAADAALRGAPWPASLGSALNLYGQGLRQIEDALGDFESFMTSYDTDLLALGRDIVEQGVSLLDEAMAGLR